MLKKKSNPWARLKYLYVLPLAAIAVAAFARPDNAADEANKHAAHHRLHRALLCADPLHGFSVFMTFLLGVKFILRPVMTKIGRAHV